MNKIAKEFNPLIWVGITGIATSLGLSSNTILSVIGIFLMFTIIALAFVGTYSNSI